MNSNYKAWKSKFQHARKLKIKMDITVFGMERKIQDAKALGVVLSTIPRVWRRRLVITILIVHDVVTTMGR